MGRSEVSLSMLPAARKARSVPSRINVLSRARKRADLWSRLLADWPALAEFARRDAEAIEALCFGKSAAR